MIATVTALLFGQVLGTVSFPLYAQQGAVAAAIQKQPVQMATTATKNTVLHEAALHLKAERLRSIKARNAILTASDPVECATGFGRGAYHIVSDASGRLYIPVQDSSKIYRVTPGSCDYEIFVSDIPGQLNGGIAKDSSGNFYVTARDSQYKDRIFRITPDGIISTFYSGTLVQYGYGLAFDPTGNLWVASLVNSSVVKITPTGIASVAYKGGLLTVPVGVIFDKYGNLFVSNYTSGKQPSRIVKFSVCGVATILSEGGILSNPNGMVIAASGNIYVANFSGNSLVQITPTGNASEYAALEQPTGVFLNPDGVIYTTGYLEGTLNLITETDEYPMGGFVAVPQVTGFTPSSGGTGTVVSIKGANFRNVYTVHFGNQLAQSFTVVSDSLITATVGTGATGPIAVSMACSVAKSSNSFVFNSSIPTPHILSFSPQVTTTGTVVTIRGKNFTGTNAITFGGVAPNSFQILSDSVITAIVGIGASGFVKVGTPQSADSAANFTYVPRPVITSFTPTTGNPLDTMIINGSNFMGTALDGTSWTTTSVYIGALPAVSFTVVSPTQIRAVIGAGTSGAVRVETLPGNVGIKTGFCLGIPRITNVAPTVAPVGGSIGIRGAGLTSVTGVRLGNINITSYTIISDTDIRIIAPSGIPVNSVAVLSSPCGTDVSPTGQSFSLAQTSAIYSGTLFVERAANDGRIDATQTITLNTNGGSLTWTPLVSTLIAGTHYTVTNVPAGLTMALTTLSPTELRISFVGQALNHANVNNVNNIQITFLDSALNQASAAFVNGLNGQNLAINFNDPSALPTPRLLSFSPQLTTTGTVVTIRGTNLSGTSSVSFAGLAPSSFNVVSDSVVTAVVADNPSGYTGFVRVTTPQGADSLTGFTYIPRPIITSFTPTAGNQGDTVLITGTNFMGTVGTTNYTTTSVLFGYVPATSFTVLSTTQIRAVVGAGASGAVRVETLPGNIGTKTGFCYGIPRITNVYPTLVPVGGSLTIGGTNLTSTTGISIGTVNITSYTILSNSLITIPSLPPGASGLVTLSSACGAVTSSMAVSLAQVTATYSGLTFAERAANDGGIDATQTITLSPNGANVAWTFATNTFIAGTHYTVANVPAGLTMVLTKISSTQLRISFTGKALNHTNANDVNNVQITFLDAALYNISAAFVTGLNGQNLTLDFNNPAAPPPSYPNILGFTPQVATTGTVVTISGFGFTGTQNVLFGGRPASSFTLVSDSTITAVVENGSSGEVSVVKTNGIATLPNFTYVPRPTISSFTPTQGNTGQVVTINGANFMGTALNGTTWTTTSVYFGGAPAQSFTVISPTQIQATVGAGHSGAVRVETLPGNVGTRNGFCYMAPVITSFAPTSASTGTQVVITGSNFTGTTAVKFNGRAAASYTVVSDTEIRAFPASNTPLTGSVSVTNPNCTDDLATFTFIPAPVIYGFWLSGGTNGDVITIDGINFDGATAVKFGDTVAASFTLVSPTRITAVVGNGKTGAVTVQGPGGAGSRSKFIYFAPGAGRPNPPIITSFTPNEGPDGTVVTINGLNFQGADWYTTAVRIGDAPDGPKTAIIQSMSATKLVVKVNGGATGKIRVYTPAGVTTSTQSFTYIPPPTITSFTPATGGAGTVMIITGTEFNNASTVKVSGTNVSSFIVDSPTQITATVAAGTTGKITVVTPGGTATSTSNFTFPTPPPAPTVTSFTPAVATTGTVVTISGSNFSGTGITTTLVSFGGMAASSFTVVNGSTIRATVGAGASGAVSVTTSAGTASKTGFTYLPNPLPTIISFSPASAAAGQTVTILGTYFTGATAVYMGSASVPFTVNHSGKITVVVPTNAASGVIQVVTPNGVAARPGFTFVPTLLFSKNPNGDEQSATSSLASELTVAATTAAMEDRRLVVYPNPTEQMATVQTMLAEPANVRWTLINALGATVWTAEERAAAGVVRQSLDVQNLPAGMYTIELRTPTECRFQRLVKR